MQITPSRTQGNGIRFTERLRLPTPEQGAMVTMTPPKDDCGDPAANGICGDQKRKMRQVQRKSPGSRNV